MPLTPYVPLARAFENSRTKLERLRAQDLPRSLTDHICVLAVGSYGRLEAGADTSDFEWITVFDDNEVSTEQATAFQDNWIDLCSDVFGRENLSINKTFGEVFGISSFVTNIGGTKDSNRALTYRMLALTEAFAIVDNATYRQLILSLARAYGGSHTAGHRLLSLATDIARYWRTVRSDFKFKIDEDGKPWAVRNMKLRSTRRVSYLASALHFVAFGPRIDYAERSAFDVSVVESFMLTMAGNPSLRLKLSARHLGAHDASVDRVLGTYSRIIEQLHRKDIREHLDRVDPDTRAADPVYSRVRADCAELHHAAADLITDLPAEPRRQIIEMFLL